MAQPRKANLSEHRHDCASSMCRTLLDLRAVEVNSKDRYKREILEVHMILKNTAGRVSISSVNISDKEIAFVDGNAMRMR